MSVDIANLAFFEYSPIDAHAALICASLPCDVDYVNLFFESTNSEELYAVCFSRQELDTLILV